MPASGVQNIGLSALLSFQRALQVTAHNIANAGTPGYSRQSVDLASVIGSVSSVGPLGGGVELQQIRRNFDNLLFTQLTETTSALGQNQLQSQLADLLDNYLGTDGFDLAEPLQQLSSSLDGLSTDPTSIAARTDVLASARALVDRFAVFDQRVQDLRTDVNSRIQSYTDDVNRLVDQIADLNVRISQQPATQGQPHDLLDKRDQAVRDLSQLMDVSIVRVDGNIYNIAVANGQSLVVGANTTHLTAVASEFDATQLSVALDHVGGPQPIDNLLGGGELGGAVSFIRDILTPAQNGIGRVAMTFADALNEQHNRGLDLAGNLGLDLFNVAAPQLLPSANNSNLLTDTTAVVIDDYSALTADDYRLAYDGAVWNLTNLSTGLNVPLTPAGPDLLADGLRFSPDPGAAAGDRYLVRPTRAGARDLALAIGQPRLVAAAAALSGTSAIANTGSGSLSPVTVLDPSDPALLNPVALVFDSATTFTVNGGPSQPYTPGANIDVNGWRLQLSGTPALGDRFDIVSNQGAVGNGDNALALSIVDRAQILEGQTLSISDAHRRLVSTVGVQARGLHAASDIQSGLLADLDSRMQRVQGVNLDEEAIKLQQFEQAYIAAAEIFAVSEAMFQTLITAVRR